jgi:hypothetical protein
MKFTLIKDLKQDAMMKPILSGLLLFILLYLVSDFFVKESSFGLMSSSVKATLFGNEEEYVEAISRASFLEFWHIEIFFIMMTVFTLSTVYIRLSKASLVAIYLVNFMMLSAISSLISLPLSYFYSSLFTNVYVTTFFLWHILALFSVVYSLKELHYA